MESIERGFLLKSLPRKIEAAVKIEKMQIFVGPIIHRI